MRRAALLAFGAALAGCSLLFDPGALSGGDVDGGHGDDATRPGREAGGDDAGDGGARDDGAVFDANGLDGDATTGAVYAQAVMADGPVAYWRLRETSGTTAKDETGRHDGTWRGAPIFGRPGPFPGSLSVRLSASQDFSADSLVGASPYAAMTYEAWASVASLGSIDWIFSFDRPDATGSSIGLSHNDAPAVFRFHDTTVAGLLGTTVTTVDTFYYVVVTVETTGAVTLYVNGAVEATTTTLTRPPSPGHFTVAANLDPKDGGTIVEAERWDGSLAELAIYDKALGAAQIAAHYAAAR